MLLDAMPHATAPGAASAVALARRAPALGTVFSEHAKRACADDYSPILLQGRQVIMAERL
ncbi:hypothetical protein NOR51B_1542 [Luminiphilus syltensis NOR5-1B]|uniref:Uncharacterized protein n=1 Tax=Luminiphilus syltensis NOR5-1B TaxID=565045 RepID=B8KSU4_9GAMM|nr:hypothetical protein NOR51B_1542 [Luminiphilus syltensis NOR5-1B]